MQNEPHANKSNNLCGAKTRSGKPCKNKAMSNGRCRMHGGKSTGAPPAKLKGNQNSKKHGFFSKYIPQETLEIMGMLNEKSPADLIWDQIQIQYAAIIRAQQIMHVSAKDEMIRELKKLKVENGIDQNGNAVQLPTEKEYEFQFAWDRHATFMNAQSRAMSELRSLVKQFNDLAFEDDERKLKLELMQANIKKANAEANQIAKENDDEEIEDIIIVDEWSDDDVES